MIEFDFFELNLLNKLFNRIKYVGLDSTDLNEFANSPITNKIMEKINGEFELLVTKNPSRRIPRMQFEMDNSVGKNIINRINHLEKSEFETISKWDKNQTGKFAIDILGPIEYSSVELNNLTEFIMKKAKEKTSG